MRAEYRARAKLMIEHEAKRGRIYTGNVKHLARQIRATDQRIIEIVLRNQVLQASYREDNRIGRDTISSD